ncbi:4-(cytidine 5'-diphospho)-2-C-methyl-D-erythritol kinase [Chitinophaga caeni]|uniref:4-diphosphocytidyl-2-C-methyl-D-erythritol kinase n=1 Tax=Chitinophaga caeni TaxID=2029983 RepID=A0A291QWU6_9BACT|nr:4-(cytidine 5'-diphospho)-2-C-methyl-D-erythritol kinase [Chitinophaga caeni]ATL48407.1 4-(cytidine 5'-diphospho)-2-C-methyl-D-erythritol kinase [Chitinophaga caeni]
MIAFPNCKINLGLHVLNKRVDGFHDLETVFLPLALKDVLEIITADKLTFTMTGINIPGSADDNLCLSAYRLLKRDFPLLPPVHIHLHKVIPTGAGLGGGSSDAAFTLKLLNEKYHLGIRQETLLQYAAQLGSDCAFFIENTPCYATGRGEILEPLAVDLSAYQFLLVHPGIHVNTGWAFGQLSPGKPGHSLREVNFKDVQDYKGKVSNDFEAAVFQAHPEIAAIKEQMYATGALYASMSGSGSAVYGIYEKGKKITGLFSETGYSVFRIS